MDKKTFEREVLKYLKAVPTGKKQPTRKQIAKHFAPILKERIIDVTRRVTEAVRQLVKDGHPIVVVIGKPGFEYTRDPAKIRRSLRSFESQRDCMAERVRDYKRIERNLSQRRLKL